MVSFSPPFIPAEGTPDGEQSLLANLPAGQSNGIAYHGGWPGGLGAALCGAHAGPVPAVRFPPRVADGGAPQDG